jgi:hypothetical protein
VACADHPLYAVGLQLALRTATERGTARPKTQP